MDKSSTRYIGYLSKLYGFSGEFVLVADEPFTEDIENWESVFIEIDGLLVPFFIDSLRITSDTSAVIGFEDLNKPEKAREFLSCKIYHPQIVTEEEKSDDTSFDLKQFNGFRVIDRQQGFVGTVESILDYGQNLLLQVMNGHKEILIPISEEIITHIDPLKKELQTNAPEGLLDLN